MELSKLFILILISLTVNWAHADSKSLKAFAKNYNQNIKSHTTYLKWLSKYETAENIDFLKKYLVQNPKIELRKLEIIDGDLVYNGKNNYSRLSVISLEKGEFKMYGKLVKVPLYKPYASILKLTKVSWNWFSLLLPEAQADANISWNGKSLDMLTSTRVWLRSSFSNNAYANGRYHTFCGTKRDGTADTNAIIKMFNKLNFSESKEDLKDNCHQVLLQLGEVVKYYNASVEKLPVKQVVFNRMLDADGQLRNMSSTESNLSQEIDTPSCILHSIQTWRDQYCNQMGRGKFQGCRIIASKPDNLFTCGEFYQPGEYIPEQIGLTIEWREPKFNRDGTPSKGQQ